MTQPNAHDWQPTGTVRPHFHEINSRRVYRNARQLRCATCGQDGFQYVGRPVIYTWAATDVEAA